MPRGSRNERQMGPRKGTYLNGRGERSDTDTGDLKVPFKLEVELVGRERWSQIAS